MRREKRKTEEIDTKIIKIASIGVAILTVIVAGLLIYGSRLNKEVKEGTLSSEQLSSLVNKTSEEENTESTSTEMGKTVNEAKNEISENTTESTKENKNNEKKQNTAKSNTTVKTQNITSNSKNNQTNKTRNTNGRDNKNNTSNVNKTKAVNNTTKAENKELEFIKPVEGEIVKEFAKDNLLFSQTLQEWTVHTGIDIKADKTTVVKAAEAGTVKSIKNDPRYGLTIVVAHENGFETIYANLLTSEFVIEGEKVEKGQSLGTVGNTAAFEMADDTHLHFEILKDSVQVDPSIYIK